MGLSYPYAGPGPTTHSAYANPNAQREHVMADPYRKGLDNLETNTEYIYDQLAQASGADEFGHLGAAAHALQDSYSGAHAWREDSVYDGDPAAPDAARITPATGAPAARPGVSGGISSEGVGRGG